MLLRYILIENNSGYIRGDSADFNGEPFEGTPVQYAQALDDSLKEHGRTYELMLNHSPRTTESGYHVYRADDAVPVVEDGQDAETIAAVKRDCQYVGFITIGRGWSGR
jgi:hypothetical protein